MHGLPLTLTLPLKGPQGGRECSGGTAESPNLYDVEIDTTAPATTASVAGTTTALGSYIGTATVTLSASTLAGLDRLPGHLEGYGAITAATALMIARSAASMRRLSRASDGTSATAEPIVSRAAVT